MKLVLISALILHLRLVFCDDLIVPKSVLGTWSTALVSSQNWTSITGSSTGMILAAATNGNGVYISFDYGQTWKKTKAPVGINFVGIDSSANADYLYLAASDPTISFLLSKDYGSTWQTSFPAHAIPPDATWSCIGCSFTGQYVILMGYGKYYYSSNYGQNFSLATNVPSPTYHQIVYSDVAIAATAEKLFGATVSYSDTYGHFFGSYAFDGEENDELTSVAISANGTVIYVTNPLKVGAVHVSYDTGYSWSSLSNAPQQLFNLVACNGDASVIMISYSLDSDNYYSYLSLDMGYTWNITNNSSQPHNAMFAARTGEIFAATSDDNIDIYTFSCEYGYLMQGYDSEGYKICTPCIAKGEYSLPSSSMCLQCEEGYYSTEAYAVGYNPCNKCSYPTTNDEQGSTSCKLVYLGISNTALYLFFLLVFIIFAVIIYQGDHSTKAAFVILFFPLFDFFTDIAYIGTSQFYNMTIFLLCCGFCLQGFIIFLYKLYTLRAFPTSFQHIFWLGYSTTATSYDRVQSSDVKRERDLRSQQVPDGDGGGDHVPYPTILGRRFTLLVSFENHSNIGLLLYTALMWIVAFTLQISTLVLYLPFLFVWLCFGAYLEMTKMICLTTVWNLWIFVWTGNDFYQDIGGGKVDTRDLNYGLLHQFLLETIPEMVIQILNNCLLNIWLTNNMSIFSFLMSSLMVFNMLYKYLYHSTLSVFPKTMKEVPLDKSIRVNFLWFSQFTLLNAKLEPYCMIFKGQHKNGIHDEDDSSLKDKLLPSSAITGARGIGTTTHVASSNDKPITATAVSPLQRPHIDVSGASSGALLQPPHEIICLLTGRVMVEPVVCEDGFTYERSAIEKYWNENGSISPLTKLHINSTGLFPNRVVQALIQKYHYECAMKKSDNVD